MTLYGNPDSFRVQKILAAAKYAGVNLKVQKATDLPNDFSMPLTPALIDGTARVFGSNAVCMHVAGAQLRGQKDDRAQIAQWCEAAESRYLPLVLGLVLPATSVMQHDNKIEEQTTAELCGLMSLLDKYLVSRTFLVGERISLADIALAFDLSPAFTHIWDGVCRSKYVNVTRWYSTIMQQPNVTTVVGPLKLCDKPAQFCAKTFKDLQQAAPKKETAKKDKKKDEKTSESKPEEEADACEAALAEEPKKNDPFAAMPKGSLNLDEFKRVYSNEDTIEKALPYFWDHFDAENYSVWYCEYKYPKELTQIFMSCNLINGMYQRLEKLRKNAFGSMALFGTDNNSTISGVWFWKGHELAFKLSPDWQIDFESYEWKKLDIKDAKTKTMVNEYFAWKASLTARNSTRARFSSDIINALRI